MPIVEWSSVHSTWGKRSNDNLRSGLLNRASVDAQMLRIEFGARIRAEVVGSDEDRDRIGPKGEDFSDPSIERPDSASAFGEAGEFDLGIVSREQARVAASPLHREAVAFGHEDRLPVTVCWKQGAVQPACFGLRADKKGHGYDD